MTPRPLTAFLARKERPPSAIYIGSLGSPATPPDLPELPHSPTSSSSVTSGLPSPPNTNSTSSGSVEGDNPKTRVWRKQPPSTSSRSTMYNGSRNASLSDLRSRGTHTDDEDDLHDHENDDDETARFDLSQRRPKGPSENMSALQRVKSLTQRNRMVLDKLSSIARGSPMPSKTSHNSPANAPYRPNSSAAASRQSLSRARSGSVFSESHTSSRGCEPHHSGSETEREEVLQGYGHVQSSSDGVFNTPTTSFSESRPSADFVRPGQRSAPTSPAKPSRTYRESQRERETSRGPSPGPSHAVRKRGSTAFSELQYEQDDGDMDVTTAALAAIASSRRSPTGSRRLRQPLPSEFRDQERRAITSEFGEWTGRGSEVRSEPQTPRRDRELSRSRISRRSPSPSPHGRNLNLARSPSRSLTRNPIVRDHPTKHPTRWVSEDLNARGETEDAPGFNHGRRQRTRGGSSDGLLTPSVRAPFDLPPTADRARRRFGEEGLQTSTSANPVKRTRSSGSGPNSTVNEDDDIVLPSTFSRVSDPRTPGSKPIDRNACGSMSARPGTSMAALHHETRYTPQTAPVGERIRRQAYTRDMEPGPSNESKSRSRTTEERTHGSVFAPPRTMTAPLAPTFTGSDTHAEHRRLMLEALSAFEAQLHRLPPMGRTTTSVVPEVFQSGQQLVNTLDRLNQSLKSAAGFALERQIDAEVEGRDGENTAEIWAQVSVDHRDHMRACDELVRSMTTYMLGMGKVLRDVTTTEQHHRTSSLTLEGDGGRHVSPEGSVAASSDKKSSDGRRSREARRSWGVREQVSSLSRLTNVEPSSSSRPGSSTIRSSATTSSEGRSLADEVTGQTPSAARRLAGGGPILSARKPFTPRDQRTSSDPMPSPDTGEASFDSQDTLQGYEPSPTPAYRPRGRDTISGRRAAPQLAIPPSLSTLPSERLLSQQEPVPATESHSRRKVTGPSNTTIRGEPSFLSLASKPTSATTAVTTETVLNISSVEGGASSRIDTSGSSFTSSGTFSRVTTATSTLNGLRQHHDPNAIRSRTSSSNSTSEPEEISPVTQSPMSGSETERPAAKFSIRRERASLDGPSDPSRSSYGTLSRVSVLRKDRRKTLTEMLAHG